MAVYKIKKFSEIDFVNIDVSRDEFILPDGKKYVFSEHTCDNCEAGGTVLETIKEPKRYVCVLCEHELAWRKFKNDFIEPTNDFFEFLLPSTWNQEVLQNWYENYKKDRIAQEKVREYILLRGKE